MQAVHQGVQAACALIPAYDLSFGSKVKIGTEAVPCSPHSTLQARLGTVTT